MKYRSFVQLLAGQAEKRNKYPALQYGNKVLSYSKLYETVMQKTEALRKTPYTCMAIRCDGSAEALLMSFAAVTAGLQTVMLEGLMEEKTLAEMTVYTDADCLFAQGQIQPAAGKGVSDGKGKMLFFTSGTTSRCKAVELSEESLLASAWNGTQELALSGEDRLLSVLPLSHVFGFVCALLWPLVNGSTVCLGRGKRHLMDDCAYYHPTVLTAVPSLLDFLLKYRLLNPELQLILIGSGDCRDELLQAVKDSGIRVSFGYGLTETSSGVAISTGGDPRAMTICQDDHVVIAPDGEILIDAGPCMMKGYYKHPEDTARVLPDRYLRSGDTGWIDKNGKLHLSGRKKDILVFSDGTKIYLPEYEAELQKYLGSEDYALICRQDYPVLVIHTEKDRQQIREAVQLFDATKSISHRISDIVFLDHPLAATAGGKKKRWLIQKEAEECLRKTKPSKA